MGVAEEYNNLGQYYLNGSYGYPLDYTKALENFILAAKNGSTDALCAIAGMYYNGTGIKQDKNKALEFYKKAATQQSVWAINAIGDMYATGECLPYDINKAYSWYEKAKEMNSGYAAFHIGKIAAEEYHDYVTAAQSFYLAVQLDYEPVLSTYNTAWAIEHHNGLSNAISLYKKAAEAGYGPAMDAVGRFLLTYDPQNAEYWFKKAVEAGYEPSKKRITMAKVTDAVTSEGSIFGNLIEKMFD